MYHHNQKNNQKLDFYARFCLLITSIMFWITSVQDKTNPIFWTSRLVSVCSFLNYITYNNNSRGCIGQFDAILVSISGIHFLLYISHEYLFLSRLDWYKILNLLVGFSVGPIYLFRPHPNFQLLVHGSALIALSMYSSQKSFIT
jgi:hypothetical protein